MRSIFEMLFSSTNSSCSSFSQGPCIFWSVILPVSLCPLLFSWGLPVLLSPLLFSWGLPVLLSPLFFSWGLPVLLCPLFFSMGLPWVFSFLLLPVLPVPFCLLKHPDMIQKGFSWSFSLKKKGEETIQNESKMGLVRGSCPHPSFPLVPAGHFEPLTGANVKPQNARAKQ